MIPDENFKDTIENTVNDRTGNLAKEVGCRETRRMLTSGTKILMMTLMTLRVGTTEIEESAFRLVREKVQRSSDLNKKSEFQRYSRFSKREKIQFLVANRDEKVVVGLLEVKVGVVKELG